MSIARTLRTLSFVKPMQMVDRAVRNLRPLPVSPPPVAHLLRTVPQPPADRASQAFDGRSFLFLNQRLPFIGTDRWQPSGASPLWLYNLHYFRYLWGIDAGSAHALVLDWIDSNPPGRGPGWDAYPISLRVREWIDWLIANPLIGDTDRTRVLRSIAHQVTVLQSRLEYHLLGNHLLENAITLCWAGLSLEHPHAPEWLSVGTRLLVRQLHDQILPDGVHDERSPMYQAILAEGLLRLAAVASTSPVPAAGEVQASAETAGRELVRTLNVLTHPDGDIALVNDSAMAVAPTAGDLRRRFAVDAAPGVAGPWTLNHAGYAGISRGDSYLVFDSGPIGPDHQPGHGHADLLSFELSHRGRRLITDTGAFTYVPGRIRSADRGTAAHNCLQVDEADQAELWAAFRCGRRPTPEPVKAHSQGDSIALRGGCVFTTDAGCRIVQSRAILVRVNEVAFRDEVAAKGRHSLATRLHFAPELRAERTAAGWRVVDGTSPVLDLVGSSLAWSQEVSPYHPEFGKEIERLCLIARADLTDRGVSTWTLVLH